MRFDTLGNELSEKQAEFFANTKIKDGDRLVVCQHLTSSAKFDKFDISKSKNSQNFGIGYYFSIGDGVYKQQEGQRKMLCYLNVERPMTNDSQYVSDEDWKAFADAVWGEGKFPFSIRSADGDGLNYVNLSKMYGGDKAKFLAAAVESLPVDGFLPTADCVVAFKPNQIKPIENKEPTDSENLDESLDAFFARF